MSKQHPKAKHLPHARNALAKIRTTQATLDSARRAAEQEGVSLSHWIDNDGGEAEINPLAARLEG